MGVGTCMITAETKGDSLSPDQMTVVQRDKMSLESSLGTLRSVENSRIFYVEVQCEKKKL